MKIQINGIDTNYEDIGTGETVLMLHGWGANITLFKGLISFMSAKYRVVAPDLPGFGGTAEPPEPWCVDDYVRFIEDFCDKTGIKEAIFFGHSFGGRIIIKMLSDKECPVKCSKAVLTGSAGILPKTSFIKRIRQKRYKMGKAFLSTDLMKKLSPDAIDKLRSKYGSADYNSATPVMRQSLVKVVNENLQPYLSEIDAEVLLIWGENDDATPLSDGKTMEREMKNAGLVTVKNAGHYAYLDQHFIFNSIIASFLNIN